VMAPMAAPRKSSSLLPNGIGGTLPSAPLATIWKAQRFGHGGHGDEHRRQADHAVR
jgi:hypothetical protein